MYGHIYKNLLDNLVSSKETVMLTHLNPNDDTTGVVSDKVLLTKDAIESDFSSTNKDEELYNKIQDSIKSGNIKTHETPKGDEVLIEPYYPKPRLIIFGGGHIAKPLVDFGAKVGFTVIVIDDRPTFANSHRFPQASEVICESFEESFNILNISKSDFVVIVTRGHRHDEVCLRKTLNYNPAYIGMIGSKRRVKGMKEKLLKENYSEDSINSINAPIGLDIGAITPEEIAIAIIGEVISYRRKRNTGDNEKFNWPEFDLDVIKEISKSDDSPKALVTIMWAKGSVPRKSGAKMIVWPHGKIVGSIGGGCSESEVINKARDIILNKGYTKVFVDMTGDVAEDEGMVCGGTMEVLIESL